MVDGVNGAGAAFFVEAFEVEALEERAGLVGRVVGAVGERGPVVLIAEELPGEATAGADGGTHLRPEAREARGRAEGQGEGRDEQVALGKREVFEAGEAGFETLGVDKVGAPAEAVEPFFGGVEGEDAPSPAEEFGGVASVAAAEVDGEPGSIGRRLGVEGTERVEEGVARAEVGEGAEIAVPVAVLGVDVGGENGLARRGGFVPGIGRGPGHTLGHRMYATLGEFVTALERAGELARVSAPVSPVLEIAEIADRESKSRCVGLPSAAARRTDPRYHDRGGRALLFTNVAGSEIPVLINAWGSYRRMEMALGCERGGFEEIAGRIAELVKPQPPRTLREGLALARRVAPLLRTPPKRRRGRGPCQEVVEQGDAVDLTRLPLIRCWPHDGDFAALGYPAGVNDGIEGLGKGEAWEREFRGRYVTLAGIHTIHADERDDAKPASHNIGMYRVQLLGRRMMAMHWHLHHDGARHWRSWKALGKPMPVAVALGGESVMPYAATAPLPPGISELLMAGFLNRGGIPMVRGVTVPLWVPANAEIVIEGYVRHDAGLIGFDPRRDGALGPGAVFEGPFGDHTGFYSLPDRYPILEVTAVTRRREAIYPTTIVGLPPQEDYYLGKATERVFLPLLKTLIPDIEDYDLPLFGAFHNCAAIAIRKAYPLQARRVMHGVWGAGQMSWTKTVVVVGDDVDVHDTPAVLRAIGEKCVPGRDTELVRGPLDILDHAAPFLGAGGKMGLDATGAWAGAEAHRALEGVAAEACAAGEIGPALGEAARAVERRVRAIAGVLDARVPEELGGWWLLVRAEKAKAGDGARVIKALGAIAGEVMLPRWTIVVGAEADIASTDEALFHWQAHAAPERDRYLSVCGRRVAFDATPKMAGDERDGHPVRDWPPLLRMDEAVRARVRARWGEYGLAGNQPPRAPREGLGAEAAR